jgi:hypothetical protein
MVAEAALTWVLSAFQRPVDAVAFALWLVVFPLYHTVYPSIARRMPGRTMLERVDTLRRSWIQRILETRDIVAAAQQTRNLNTVNTTLASSG